MSTLQLTLVFSTLSFLISGFTWALVLDMRNSQAISVLRVSNTSSHFSDERSSVATVAATNTSNED